MTLPTLRPVRTLTVALAASALAAPAASAGPYESFRPGEEGNRASQAVPVRVMHVEADQSFDWGDAGLGATGLLAVLAIAGGAAVAGGYRPGRQPEPIR